MNGCPYDSSAVFYMAALKGDLDLLKWVREKGGSWNPKICASAAAGGQLEALKWLRENGCSWDHTTCGSAAGGDTLRF